MKGMSIDNIFIVGASIVKTANTSSNSSESGENVTAENNTPVEEIITDNVESEATDTPVEGEVTVEGDVTVEGEQTAENGEATVEGEGIDTGVAEDGMTGEVNSQDMSIDPIVDGVMPGMEGGGYEETMGMGLETVKDPLLSSWPAVIGISGAVLLVSILLGALMAKRKIKKGIDLYED